MPLVASLPLGIHIQSKFRSILKQTIYMEPEFKKKKKHVRKPNTDFFFSLSFLMNPSDY